MKHIALKNALVRLTATMLLFMGTIPATAQYFMNIRQADGTQLRYAVSSVDSVWFDKDVHEYVDLGLSVKWATCNIGATAPEDYGDYFAWGETETKTDYSWSTYKYCNGSSYTMTKYCNISSYGDNGFTDTLTTLVPEDDVAHVKWGGSWRMPTQADFNELFNNCDWSWVTQNGINGWKVTSRKDSSLSIFLPGAGCRYGTNFDGVGSYGVYISSSLYVGDPVGEWRLYFSSDDHSTSYYSYRYHGYPVRPVCP